MSSSGKPDRQIEGLKGKLDEPTTISWSSGLFAGLAAFLGGAAISGASHFASTAKALEEEGISKAQRLQALPTAAKAFTVASGMTVLMGATVYIVATQTGFLQVKPSADVSSVHEALALAEDQRALIREHFQKRIGAWQSSEESVQKIP